MFHFHLMLVSVQIDGAANKCQNESSHRQRRLPATSCESELISGGLVTCLCSSLTLSGSKNKTFLLLFVVVLYVLFDIVV